MGSENCLRGVLISLVVLLIMMVLGLTIGNATDILLLLITSLIVIFVAFIIWKILKNAIK